MEVEVTFPPASRSLLISSHQIEVLLLGDSLTLKWNEYPAAFWCDSFSGDGQCLSSIRPVFEQKLGWRYNAAAFGIAGRYLGGAGTLKTPIYSMP